MDLDFVWDDKCIFSLIEGLSSAQINTDQFNDGIKQLTDICSLVKANDTGEVYINDDFYDCMVNNERAGVHLASFPAICRDSILVLHRMINKSRQYIPEEVYDEAIFDISSSSADCYLDKNQGGVISSRAIEMSCWWNSHTMYKADTIASLEHIYRKHIKNSLPAETVIWEFSNVLWSNLYFHPKPPRLSNLKVCLNTHFELILDHLSYINDYAFEDYERDQSQFVAEASSKGVELSGESNNTRGNNSAMKERKIKIENHEVTCELHTKITYNKGRIHFHFGNNLHPDVLKKTNGKVIIGMLVEHLTV